MYPIIKIFNKEIGITWVIIVISLIIMSIINCLRAKKYGMNYFDAIIISTLVNIFAIFGAHFMFRIENIGKEIHGFGLSFFGTVFFLPLFMGVIGILYKNKSKYFIDYWALTIPLELSFVRFGCFLSGCCLGIINENGVHFPLDPQGVNRIPVQLYESIFDFLLFAFLILVEKKIKIKKILYPVFMVTYGMIRFIMEFYRDTSKYLFGLSNGQIFSFVSIIIGIIWLLVSQNKYYKKG